MHYKLKNLNYSDRIVKKISKNSLVEIMLSK